MGIEQFYLSTGFSRGPVLFILPSFWKTDGTGKMVIAAPGHLAPETDFNLNKAAGKHLMELVKTGYGVAAFKFSQWAQPIVSTEFDDLVTYLGGHAKVKCRTDKFGLVGWSMGGFNTLRITRERPTKVAAWWGWNAALDGQWLMQTDGYTPPYSLAGISSTLTDSTRTEISGLFGVAAGSVPPAGMDALALADQHRGKPLHLVQALDDATIPQDSAVTFRNAVADPLCTLSQPASGGHLDPFSGTPVRDFLQFFHKYW